MIVCLFNDDMVLVYPDRLPPEGGSWCQGLSKMARYDVLLPDLLASTEEIVWLAGYWTEQYVTKLLVPVPREFMQAVLDFEVQKVTDLLYKACTELPSTCPICQGPVQILWPDVIGASVVPLALRCNAEPSCWRTAIPVAAFTKLGESG